MKANWYRNPPEKDQGKPQGTGDIIHFGLLESRGEGTAVIVDDKGNLHEKPFSLVRVIVDKPEAPGPTPKTAPKPVPKPAPTKQK